MTEFDPKNFPGNPSVKKPNEEPEKKRVAKVTQGKVAKRKEPLLYRIFGGETAAEIGNYILWDVIIPAAKTTFSDLVNGAIDMAFYGDQGSPKRSSRIRRGGSRSYVSYNSIYDGSRKSAPSRRERRTKDRHAFSDIVFANRGDAEEVLGTLVELVDVYEVVTVEDFYDACGLPSEYTDGKWGWESLERAQIRPIRGGYFIDFPRAEVID